MCFKILNTYSMTLFSDSLFVWLFKRTLEAFCMFVYLRRTLKNFKPLFDIETTTQCLMHILTKGLSIYLVGEDCKEVIKKRKRKNREKLVLFNKWQHPWNFTKFSQSYSYRTKLNHVLKGTNAFSHIYCRKFQRLANPLKQEQ